MYQLRLVLTSLINVIELIIVFDVVEVTRLLDVTDLVNSLEFYEGCVLTNAAPEQNVLWAGLDGMTSCQCIHPFT